MKSVLRILAVFALFGIATADYTKTCSWEGTATILGQYGDVLASISTVNVHAGTQSLYLVHDAGSGIPQAFVALITGLLPGDNVHGEFWRYDVTSGASPSCRIWGHWISDPGDINSYSGYAGGNTSHGPGTGWDLASWTWSAGAGNENLVIEVRIHESAGDYIWIDDMSITAPDNATILTPDETPVHRTTWGEIKVAF
ncbi:MAG: hypothetical protein GQ565_01005 [Candidatus Aegiribacteria sp.]|nr:hypothetical protein [Candidatus Aegiribacteria sp.]